MAYAWLATAAVFLFLSIKWSEADETFLSLFNASMAAFCVLGSWASA